MKNVVSSDQQIHTNEMIFLSHLELFPTVKEHVRLSQSKGALNTKRNHWEEKKKGNNNMIIQGLYVD